MKVGQRIARALTTILVVCLGVRLAAWLVAPLLPPILIGCVLVSIVMVVLGRR